MNETINRRTPSSGGPPAALLVEGTAQPSQVQAAAPSDEASLRARKEALLADLDRLAKRRSLKRPSGVAWITQPRSDGGTGS